jgi:hypothetical protein
LDASAIRRMPAIANQGMSEEERAANVRRAIDAHRQFLQETPAGAPKDSLAWGLIRAHWPGWRRDTRLQSASSGPKKARSGAPSLSSGPPPKPPQPALLHRYLLLRRLKVPIEAALERASIGRAASQRAEAMLEILPTLAEARGHERRKSEAAEPLLDLASKVLDEPSGRALVAAIRTASRMSATTLGGILNPRASAPAITAERVLACRDMLPRQLRIEVGIAPACWPNSLSEALSKQPRVRCKRLPGWTSLRPRVRLMLTEHKVSIDHSRACALTLIAQMALALWQDLPKEN